MIETLSGGFGMSIMIQHLPKNWTHQLHTTCPDSPGLSGRALHLLPKPAIKYRCPNPMKNKKMNIEGPNLKGHNPNANNYYLYYCTAHFILAVRL